MLPVSRQSTLRTIATLAWILIAGDVRAQDSGWSAYDGDAAGTHFSALIQIDKTNITRLQEVWHFEAGVGSLQTNPLIVGHRLYAFTTQQQVIALDAATGKSIWKFASGVAGAQPARGLAYWSAGGKSRLFAGIMDHLYALDPVTGRPIKAFGENGKIDLRKNLGNDFNKNSVYLTSPGVIFRDLIILGFRTGETAPAAPGAIRAYDVHTGKLRWSFHTIPRPGQLGHDTWPVGAWKTAGAANNWAGMVVDTGRGIVFAPTGSAVSDFYGFDRKGDDLFADSLLAIDAATGKLLWHFQGVHHDIWDRDFPSPPVLLTVKQNGQPLDVVAQTTKQGFVFVFERVTGKPVFPIEERPFPASTVPGEVASPTQPVSQLPAPYARQELTADLLTERTPSAHAWALEQFKTFAGGGLFIPFSVDKQTIVFPGFDGGGEWGGPAVDPARGVIFVNANDLAWTGGLTAAGETMTPGRTVYASQCATCHGADRRGSPPDFPSLDNIGGRLSAKQITDIVGSGRGRMPGFPTITGRTLTDLVTYLNGADTVTEPAREIGSAPTANSAQPAYHFTGYKKFLDPDGYPAVASPWGTLNAIDLNSGQYLWKVPLGEYPQLIAQGQKNTGSENYGGPVVTASGLVIIAATIYDNKIRAFDSSNGAPLWESALPYAGNATPATYMVDGRQYLVIATSGARNRDGPQGSAYVAFALPQRRQ